MDQLKQILQLKKDGVATREIVRRTGMSRNSVRKYLARLNSEPQQLTNKALADTAYNNDAREGNVQRLEHLMHFFKYAAPELTKTGVTRQLLWSEYLLQHPGGYGYSQFCYHLNAYQKHSDLSMHLDYNAGDMIMIDFAGKKLYYINDQTGERIDCQVFVSILPCSGLIFCHVVHSQKTTDLITCINAMLRFYAGSPATILCDNLRTAVIRPDKYEPLFTEVCSQLGEHYGTTFSATRPYSPRDKAMVERAVNIVYTQIYAPLRNTVFTSLPTLNRAVSDQLLLLNDKPYKTTPYSRWYFYEQQERSTLRPLPPEPFSPKKVVLLTVQRNYHVQLSENHHYFSAPYKYVGKKVKVLYDDRVVEIYFEHERIAIHIRRPLQKAYSTLAEHMPPHHQRMAEIKGWNKDDLLQQAARIGSATLQAATLMLDNSICVQQNYKACFGMLMLHKKYGIPRLEAACTRALQGTRVNYTMIKNILEAGLDKSTTVPEKPIPHHENIRGKDHYK